MKHDMPVSRKLSDIKVKTARKADLVKRVSHDMLVPLVVL